MAVKCYCTIDHSQGLKKGSTPFQAGMTCDVNLRIKIDINAFSCYTVDVLEVVHSIGMSVQTRTLFS